MLLGCRGTRPSGSASDSAETLPGPPPSVAYWLDAGWLNRGFCIQSADATPSCKHLHSRIPESAFLLAWQRQAAVRTASLQAAMAPSRVASRQQSPPPKLAEVQRRNFLQAIEGLQKFRDSGPRWLAALPAEGRRFPLPLVGVPEGDGWQTQLAHDAFAAVQFRFVDQRGVAWRFGGSAVPFLTTSNYCQDLFGSYRLPSVQDATFAQQSGIDALSVGRILRVHYPQLSVAQGYWTSDMPQLNPKSTAIKAYAARAAWMQAWHAGEVAGLMVERQGWASVLCRQSDDTNLAPAARSFLTPDRSRG